MSTNTSLLEALLQALPHLPQFRPQLYFKSSLTALSHAMEDQVLAGAERPLVIASFQRERFYRQEAHRYLRIAERTDQVYVLAAPETDFANRSGSYETVAFESADELSHEWHLVVIGQQYASCLVCREREDTTSQVNIRRDAVPPPEQPAMDQTRRFEGVWTFDRQVTCKAAELLLDRVLVYRPELAKKIAQAKAEFLVEKPSGLQGVDPDPFVERLVTYLQAGQYKLLKTYRSIAAQERKERLVNSISSAIRRSLNPDEIFKVAVQELGQTLRVCRCLMYRCRATDVAATIQYEFLSQNAICADSAIEGATATSLNTAPTTAPSLSGQAWPLQNNPLFQEIAQKLEFIHIEDTTKDARVTATTDLHALTDRWQIRSWLMVPLLYQDRLMGMVELHHCGAFPHRWADDELSLVEAIATQVGVALIQAEAYANLEDLNQQLEAFDRTRSNLIAITGHELRTPLSTIQVCLESLASEPDMPLELRQVMLNTALTDAERMRKLVQDFLTLSRLESGRVQWNLEPLPLQECVDLALSSIHSRQSQEQLPRIAAQVPPELPLVRADGEWLVEVLSKLLENACKFTEPEGQVTIEARRNGRQMLEVTITDTGRGIEPNRLEAVFDRFYQEEGALRRTTGGTGLGLAICRQIITGLGGQIWAESAGRDCGSCFHFTVPISQEGREMRSPSPPKGKTKLRNKRISTRS